jgi:pimeloyl-ACP methyl ester carboxylesterase
MYRRQFDEEFARRMAAPEIVKAREELRASGVRDQKRAFELSVAGYFRDFRDAKNLTPFRVNARTQQAVWGSLGEYDLRDQLRALRPTPHALVVHGTFDPIPIAGSREIAGVLGANLVELPVGHCPHVEATDDFVRALDDFLPKQ